MGLMYAIVEQESFGYTTNVSQIIIFTVLQSHKCATLRSSYGFIYRIPSNLTDTRKLLIMVIVRNN